jgi:hypothetical protein
VSLVNVSDVFRMILSDGFLSCNIYLRLIVLLGNKASWILIRTFSLLTNRSRMLYRSTYVNWSDLNLPWVRSFRLTRVSSKSDLEL